MSVKRIFIKTPNEFMKMVGLLKKAKVIAFDTEYVDYRFPNLDLVGISFCIKDKEDYLSFYVTINHKNVIHKIQKYKEKIIKEIKPILEDKNKLIIMHNVKSEIKIMWLHRIYIQDSEYFNNIFSNVEIDNEEIDYETAIQHNFKYEVPKEEHHIFDTMIASWCLYQDRPCKHGLKELTEEIYKKKSPHFKEIAFRDKKNKMWRIDLGDFKKVAYYACEDAINTYKLKEHFEPLIDATEKTKKLYYELALQQAKVLSEMEIAGIPTRKKTLQKIGKNIDKELKILKKEIYKICGTEEINLNSMQQLNKVFFKKLKIKPLTKKGKNGFHSLGKNILVVYAKDGVDIAKYLLKYRMLFKLKSTYVDGLISKIVDNKIFGNFHQLSTRTGRLSSSDPNFQNQPNNLDFPIRSAFCSPKGYAWICLDYNQLELRIASHCGNDNVMIEAFKSGSDFHGLTAKTMFKLDCEANEVKKKYPKERRKIKKISFGVLYGMSHKTMAMQINLETNFESIVTDDEMFVAKSGFFNLHKGITKYIKGMKNLVHKTGIIKTIIGRERYLPDGMINEYLIKDNKERQDAIKRKAQAERQAVNTRIQGSASDVITIAMRDVRNYFIEKNLWFNKMKLINQVHDEISIIVEKELAEEVYNVVKNKMENAIKLKVPLIAEGKIEKNWFLCKD